MEVAHALYYYYENGLAPAIPSQRSVQGVHAITNGNAKEVRLLAPKLTLINSGMF